MARILSLDDEPGFLKLLQMILERAGHESLTTTDAEEALSILRSQSIDLLTQDFMRPHMDGFELLHLMKSDENLRTIPILAVTAGAKDFRAAQLEETGLDLDLDRDLDGFLSKPFLPQDLLTMVEAILERHSKPSSP
jgi:CheY-like chemotaxis protein